MKNRLVILFLYLLSFGFPIYFLLDVYKLSLTQQVGPIFVIILLCLQFTNLEDRVSKMEDEFWNKK